MKESMVMTDAFSLEEVLRLTCQEALNSPDPSTQNGAVLVRSNTVYTNTFACNQFPPGVQYTEDRWERPAKYEYIEHAERGAIYSAARQGIPTQGLTLVCPWAACADCARAIICAGVQTLVTMSPHGNTHTRWQGTIDTALVMLEEAGVGVVRIDGPLGNCQPLRRNGELIEP